MSSVSQGRQTNPLDLHCVGFIPRTNDGLLLLLISSPDCGLSKVHSVRICLLSGKIYHAVCFFWSVWYEIPLKLSNCIKQFLCLRHMGSQCTRLKSNYSGERKIPNIQHSKNVAVCSSAAPPDTFMDFTLPRVTHTENMCTGPIGCWTNGP